MQLSFLTIFLAICSQSSLYAHFYEKPHSEEAVNSGDKLYVQPADIRLTANGIYLDMGGGRNVEIPNIQSDSRGLFTLLDRDLQRKYATYTCPGCGKEYSWWENCTTPGCPRK